MKKRISIFLLILFLVSSASFVWAADEVIKVGYWDAPGMLNGASPDQRKSGYAYDLLQVIASHTGFKYEYVYGEFSDLYDKLLDGKIDILPSVCKTEERKSLILFPNRYLMEEIPYIAIANGSNVSTLNGKSIGIEKNYCHIKTLKDYIASKNLYMNVVEFENTTKKLEALKNGEIDFVLEINVCASPLTTCVINLEGMPSTFGVAMGRPDLLRKINAAMTEIDKINPFLMDNLKQRYFAATPNTRAVTYKERNWAESHKVIKIGAFTDDIPYTLKDANGNIVGVFPEVVRYMLDRLSVQSEVAWRLYDSLDDMHKDLASGKLDVIIPEYCDYYDAEQKNINISNKFISVPMGMLYAVSTNPSTVKTIATAETRLGISYVRDNYPDATVIPCKSVKECINMVLKGKADCAIAHTSVLQHFSEEYKQIFAIMPLTAPCDICFATKTADSPFLEIINRGIALVSPKDINMIEMKYTAVERNITAREFFSTHKQYIYIPSAVLLILIFLILLQIKEKKMIRLNNALKLAEVKSSMRQMQPHFLYNALCTIREILVDDPQYAAELIVDFTTHLRACIRAMEGSNLIPFDQELENIEAYVHLEKIRWGEKLKMVYDLNVMDFDVVPLGIQPLVENAIRYGTYKRGKAGGTVTLSTFRDDAGYVVVQIKDTGVGFDYEQLMRDVEAGKRDSTGLKNVIFRFDKLMGATVDVKSELGVGTTVTVKIKEN